MMSRRRWATVAGALAVGLALVMLWQGPEGVPIDASTAPLASPAASAVPYPADELAATSAGTASAALAVAVPTALPAAPAQDDSDVQDCVREGQSVLKRTQGAVVQRRGPASTVLRDTLARMAASSDREMRAAGLRLQSVDRISFCTGGRCPGLNSTEKTARLAAAHQLALLAHEPGQTMAVAWALASCEDLKQIPRAATVCEGLNAALWTQAAPQQVWAWLALAGEMFSSQVNRPQLGFEALRTAATATDWTDPDSRLRQLLAQSLPPETPLSERLKAQSLWAGAAVSGNKGVGALARGCREAHAQGLEMGCNTLLQGAVTHSDSLLSLSIASNVAKAVGVSSREITEAQTMLKQRDLPDMAEPETLDKRGLHTLCQAIVQRDRLTNRGLYIGEVAALRERLSSPAASPSSTPPAVPAPR